MGIIELNANDAGVERVWSHTVGIANRALVTRGKTRRQVYGPS